jgi:hypothetical protein
VKLTTGILIAGLALGTASAQNLDQIQNARDTMHAVQQKKANDSNAALGNSAQPVAAHKSAAVSAPSASPRVMVHKAASGKRSAMARKSQPAKEKEQVSVEANKNAAAGSGEKSKAITATGRRDPFVSPVMMTTMVGSGCSTGKRCLAVDQINVKGVVRAESGMIAVVVNSMDKAYFLRENDPVFNGYVVRITGDSVIFKETVQDRMGKSFTREVTKKITAPAV